MRYWFYFSIATLFLVLDQLIKNIAIKKTLPEMGGFLVSYCNPNIAWSIQINTLFFWFIWIMIIVLILYNLRKSFNLPLLIVLFGAISNIIDRFIQGCVIDYINLPYFPAFNIADIMITIGMALFVIKNIYHENTKQN